MKSADILDALDRACDSFEFPMLDNGYVYLAATRLSAYRSRTDWAIVAEVFGFSPRARTPDVHTCTVASRLHDRTKEHEAKLRWYERILPRKPGWEARFMSPIDENDWQDPEDPDLVAANATEISLRGRILALPSLDEYQHHGIELEASPRVQTFELCRWLAAVARDDVLATSDERRAHVPPALGQFLLLDEWHHPDLADGARPSHLETFHMLADAIVSGDPSAYRPEEQPNTHWRNWPDGGLL